MKEASWNDYIENNSVKKISPDIERANSLIKTSRKRIAIINKIRALVNYLNNQ